MGIKFNCPNGHKLNVKTFLAGKRGICPHCGIKLMIPPSDAPAGTVALPASGSDIKSEQGFSQQPAREPQQPAGSFPAGGSNHGYGSSSGTQPYPGGGQGYGQQSAAPTSPASFQQTAPAQPVVPTQSVPTQPASSAQPAPQAHKPDPIEEAPNAAWYVRPASGGQFGPARGDIMRKWLGEGRVSSDSLVWREGWGEWQTASTVFPSLGGSPNGTSAGGISSPISPGAGSIVNAAPAASGAATSPRARKKKSSGGMSLMIVALLGILAVSLMVALVFVVQSLNR